MQQFAMSVMAASITRNHFRCTGHHQYYMQILLDAGTLENSGITNPFSILISTSLSHLYTSTLPVSSSSYSLLVLKDILPTFIR